MCYPVFIENRFFADRAHDCLTNLILIVAKDSLSFHCWIVKVNNYSTTVTGKEIT
jgi:hypothetical protein